jgi:hypothetical protein
MPDLYEIRVGRKARSTMKIYDTDADVLVPLEPFCALIDVMCQAPIARTGPKTAGVVATETTKTSVSIAGGTAGTDTTRHDVAWDVTIQGKRVLLSKDQVVVRNDTAYVSVVSLATFLHVTPIIDRDDASVTLLNADHLPVMRKAARARLHALLDAKRLEATGTAAVDIVRPIDSDGWGGLTVDYMLLNQGTVTHSLSSYLISASTTVAGGSLIARTSGGNRQVTHGDVSWLGVWSHERAVTQLWLGEGDAGGLGTIRIRGLTIGNVPYARPNTLDIADFEGTLPPDWSIEAYCSGTLVGFDSVGAGGQYALQLPVGYGENPYTFVAYGPRGQTRTFTQLFRALPSLLPAHALEYQSSMGQCVQRNCLWMTNNDVHYGLTSHWTVRGGTTEYFFHDAPTTFHPYLAITGAPAGSFSVNLETVGALYNRAGLHFDPSTLASLSVEYTQYADDYATHTLVAGGQRSTTSFTGHLFAPSGRVGLEMLGVRIADTLGTHTLVRGGAMFAFNGATVWPYVRSIGDLGTYQTFLGASAVIGGSALRLFPNDPWWLRGMVEMSRRHASQFEVTVTQGGIRHFQLEGGLRWQRTLPGLQFVLGVTTDLNAMRSATEMTTLPGSSAPQVTQSLSGAVYWNSATHHVMTASDALLGRAGVAGVVFLDQNGNGRRDAGEEPIAGVTVRVGYATVQTDGAGRYQLWGVEPTTYVRVSVDTATLASPWWVPVFNRASVGTLPNRAVSLDIPVVETGVVDGVIVSNGVVVRGPVILTNVSTGRHISVTPFSDGTFYRIGLRPGRYVATLVGPTAGSDTMRDDDTRSVSGTMRLAGARTSTDGDTNATGSTTFEIRARTITRHVELVVRDPRAVDVPHRRME